MHNGLMVKTVEGQSHIMQYGETVPEGEGVLQTLCQTFGQELMNDER